jgi:hypothetical protein
VTAAFGVICGVIIIVVTAGIALLVAAIGDLAKQETQTRLSGIPNALLRLAVMRLPADRREDVASELEAEMAFVLEGTDGLPITRLVRGIWFAASLLASARSLGRELPNRPVLEIAADTDIPADFIGLISYVVGSKERTRNLALLLAVPFVIVAGGVAILVAVTGWGHLEQTAALASGVLPLCVASRALRTVARSRKGQRHAR